MRVVVVTGGGVFIGFLFAFYFVVISTSLLVLVYIYISIYIYISFLMNVLITSGTSATEIMSVNLCANIFTGENSRSVC